MAARWTVIALVAAFAVAASAQAQTPPPTGGYLNGAPLGYAPPPKPTDPLVNELDLNRVRAATPAKDSMAFQEAKSDADAYYAKDIVRRFDDATGQLLYQGDRPLLVALLTKVIVDTGAYVDPVKKANGRPRPYIEDPSIPVCEMAYLAGTEHQSYPSGHAMNGYATALILAEVFPDHRNAIVARGVRYGDNRVVCGVHHPIDVDAGRLFGIAYFDKVMLDPKFKADLQCVEAEQALIKDKTPLPKPCADWKAEVLRTPVTATAAKLF